MDDPKPSHQVCCHPVCPAGEYCIQAGLTNELQARVDTLAKRNKELYEAITTIAKLPHTCSATVGPRQCPPCTAQLYAYARDQAENRADKSKQHEARNASFSDKFNAGDIAAELIRELIADERSLWLRLIKQERLKEELQRAYDLGKVASEAQNTRLRAVLDATEALREALKVAGV